MNPYSAHAKFFLCHYKNFSLVWRRPESLKESEERAETRRRWDLAYHGKSIFKDCTKCLSRWEESTERAEKEAEVAHFFSSLQYTSTLTFKFNILACPLFQVLRMLHRTSLAHQVRPALLSTWSFVHISFSLQASFESRLTPNPETKETATQANHTYFAPFWHKMWIKQRGQDLAPPGASY